MPPTPLYDDLEEDLFHRASQLASEAERRAFLDRECKGERALRDRVLELLRAASPVRRFLGEQDFAEGVGSEVGRYRLVERLGEGGFGEVFRAERIREDLPPIALKIVKAGMDSRQVLERFELERRALARMDHPGIARVLDADIAASGRPFFVMELVCGPPITAFADLRRLTIDERLRLFCDVCRAVQHAHQKGIIHRDLKPSNVLVTEVDGEPVPKVIDFGIAKAMFADDSTPALTQPGLVMGTPQYMSPEQTGLEALDIDARTDIFSLGVLLFELLTGTTPIESRRLGGLGIAGILRRVEECRVPRPSRRVLEQEDRKALAALRRADPARLARRLERDLDWVVLKALERDRERRYASAWEFAEDVRRVLRDEPVVAGPPTRAYRLKKFLRRNRVAVAAGSLVAAALLVAAAGTTAGYLEAAAARDGLERSNARLERTVEFQKEQIAASLNLGGMAATLRSTLLDWARRGWTESHANQQRSGELPRTFADVLEATNLTSVVKNVVGSEILDRYRTAIDEAFQDDSRLRAEMLHHLARAMLDLGFTSRAVPCAEQARALRSEALGEGAAETVESTELFGVALRVAGRLDEAGALLSSAWQDHVRVLGEDAPESLRCRTSLAVLRSRQGRSEEAESIYTDILARARRALGATDPVTLRAAGNFAAFLFERGRTSEAAPLFREAYDGWNSLDSRNPKELWSAAVNLALLLDEPEQQDEAKGLARGASDWFSGARGEDHQDTLQARNALGIVLNRGEEFESALDQFRRVAEGFERLLGPAHPNALSVRANVASTLHSLGRLEESEREFGGLIARARAAFPPGHPSIGRMQVGQAEVLADLKRFPEAKALLLKARRQLVEALEAAHPWVREANSALAELHGEWDAEEPGAGHAAEAERWRGLADTETP